MNQELHSISGITDPDKIKEAAELAVQRRLESFEYKVVGDETLDEVIALAREDWEADAEWREIQRRRRPGGQRQEQYRPADDRLAVDFLRHQRTEYDRQLQEIQESLSELKPVDDDGENPLEHFFDDLQNRAHAAIREKTLEAIRARYPELAAAVAHRRDSNYTMTGGHTFHVGRPTYLY